MSKRRSWFVDRETTLAEVLSALGEDASAVDEGRVFIGRIRARRADAKVTKGTRVDVADRVIDAAPRKLVVLGETGEWIAVSKPAGIATVADHASTTECLHADVAAHLRMRATDVHPTSRLDRDVSGVVIFATTERGRDELMIARELGRYQRRYVAIAETRAPLSEEGTWNAAIGRGTTPLLRAANGPEPKIAKTTYRVVGREGAFVALVVFPQTGRTHQIRVHAAHAGAPLLGDASYGGKRRLTTPRGSVIALERILLHAREVVVGGHRYLAPLPDELSRVWAAISKDDGVWERALAVPFS